MFAEREAGMLNLFREQANPVHLRSYSPAKVFSFCSNATCPCSLPACSPRKKLWLLLWNTDLRKSLSPQVWPTLVTASFSGNVEGASHHLALKCQKCPFLNFSSCAHLMLHLGRIRENSRHSSFPTLRNEENHFPCLLYPRGFWELLGPYGHAKLWDGGAGWFAATEQSSALEKIQSSNRQHPVFCLGASGRARADVVSTSRRLAASTSLWAQ